MNDSKYNIILHVTSSCNYNCSYCSVIKDGKKISSKQVSSIINFIKHNSDSINTFKFFGGEPLIAFTQIKNIIDSTKYLLQDKYEIVTNTSFINDEIGEYFSLYFGNIFFSIDSENFFDLEKITNFIFKFNLVDKVYFNIIVSPGKENIFISQFNKLYEKGFRNFNILPVYFTKEWSKDNLLMFSKYLKNIIDLSLSNKQIKLYGFQKNNGYNYALTYKSLFIDVDMKCYYTDFASTKLALDIKNDLFLGNLVDIDFADFNNFGKKQEILLNFENSIIQNLKGQRELHSIMDYFSLYLNKKEIGIIKD